jgi:hypothetical protein
MRSRRKLGAVPSELGPDPATAIWPHAIRQVSESALASRIHELVGLRASRKGKRAHNLARFPPQMVVLRLNTSDVSR